jgi:hypothetical protein
VTKTSAELEREVEASRGDLDRTVEALKDKMTPGQLFDELTHTMGGAGNQLLGKLVDQAKENPLPVALVGVGLAWLMMGSNKPSQPSTASYGGDGRLNGAAAGSEGHSIGERVGDAFGATTERLSDAAGSLKDGAASAASHAGDAVRATGERLTSLAGSTGHMASNLGHSAQHSLTEVLEREPLVIGALGIAVGVALGAALPATRIEDERVGPVRDQLLEKTRDFAHEQAHGVTDMAASAYTSVKSEIERQAGPDGGDSLGEKVGHVAQAGVEAVQQQLDNRDQPG